MKRGGSGEADISGTVHCMCKARARSFSELEKAKMARTQGGRRERLGLSMFKIFKILQKGVTSDRHL